MLTEFSKTIQGEKGFSTTVNAIYRLHADDSYHIKHERLRSAEHVCIYVTAGDGIIKIDGQQYHLSTGDVFLFDGGLAPFEYFTLESLWDFWWFEFTADLIPIPCLHKLPLRSEALIDAICEKSLELHGLEQWATASTLFAALLCYFAQRVTGFQRDDHRRELLYRAQLDIRQQLATVTVASVAAGVGISTRTLCSLFHEHLHIPPKQYILAMRLEHCAYLLRSTNKTIADIAAQLGFSSQFHLCKAFKAAYGMPPRDYRKQCNT